jgi:hypothetical protein
MIICTVCGAQNDALAIVCSSCKSFLQTKVDNLNLFETLWGLMETPGATFRRIALARHKNYTVLLSSLLGCSLVFGVVWYKALGASFANLAMLVLSGAVAGPPVGTAFVVLLALLIRALGRIVGGKGSFKNVFAAVAYAASPVVYSLVLVFPIQIAIFGIYFFGNNPPPAVINPALYYVLVGIDGAAVLWSGMLLAAGLPVALGISRGRGAALAVAVALILGACAFALRLV